MTDMARLRKRLGRFLAPGVTIEDIKLEAGEELVLIHPDGYKFCFSAIGDDHTYLDVGDSEGNLT